LVGHEIHLQKHQLTCLESWIVKKLKNYFVDGLRATLFSSKAAVRPFHALDLSWTCGLETHCLSDCGCGCDCNYDFDSCCESQIARRHFSKTFCGEILSDFLMMSIVGVLVQENPVLTIRIVTVDSGDPCRFVCLNGPGTSRLWVTLISFVYLPFLPEIWPSIAGLIYQSRVMRCDSGSSIGMTLMLNENAQGTSVGYGQPDHRLVCLEERNYHARMNLWSL
jgi:hypothetical protein